jgi:dTDP-4-amino-4,6-dideoxygalactose transaminase
MMKTLQSRESKGDSFAYYFHKKYGELVYSGTLALETALVALGVGRGDYVIVPDNVCYRILLTIVRLQAIPVIINPRNGLILTVEDIRVVVEKYKIKAVLLLHNMGLPVAVDAFRQTLGNKMPIIEDASQAWNLEYSGFPVGAHSDYVITSFGKTKPLNFGVGGAIFANDDSFKKYLDFNDKTSRHNPKAILPYVLPETIDINILQLIAKGNDNVLDSRRIADIFMKELCFPEIKVWSPAKGDKAGWHRFPIFVKSQAIYRRLLDTADKHHIRYELPHKINLSAIPMALRYNCLAINNRIRVDYQINLYTNKNTLKNIKLWAKELKRLKK